MVMLNEKDSIKAVEALQILTQLGLIDWQEDAEDRFAESTATIQLSAHDGSLMSQHLDINGIEVLVTKRDVRNVTATVVHV
jgi:hypothetical protein